MAEPKQAKQIVSLDPGLHVGIAWRNPDGTLDATMIYLDLQRTYKFLLDNPHPKICVFEDFQTAGNISKDGLYTVRVIGGIQTLCLEHNIPCVLQIPSARYSFRDDAAAYLTRLRGSKRRWVVHEMDALAHLLAFENRQANEYRRAALVTPSGAVGSRTVSTRSVSPTGSRPRDIVARLRSNSNLS